MFESKERAQRAIQTRETCGSIRHVLCTFRMGGAVARVDDNSIETGTRRGAASGCRPLQLLRQLPGGGCYLSGIGKRACICCAWQRCCSLGLPSFTFSLHFCYWIFCGDNPVPIWKLLHYYLFRQETDVEFAEIIVLLPENANKLKNFLDRLIDCVILFGKRFAFSKCKILSRLDQLEAEPRSSRETAGWGK